MLCQGLDGVAFITGGGGGIGREVAWAFAEAGARAVVLADLNEDAAKDAAEKCKPLATHANFAVLALKVDVTDTPSVDRAVETAVKTFGRIDYAVNGAGIDSADEPISEQSEENFAQVMKVNTHGLWAALRAETRAMLAQEPRHITNRGGKRDIGRGVIVNIASAHSYVVLPGKTAYVASKYAVLGITKNAALDCTPGGVRVNAICPTWVRTAMVAEAFERQPALVDVMKAAVPLKRMAEPIEIAEVVMFLCSASASYLSGIGMVIDAGATLTMNLN